MFAKKVKVRLITRDSEIQVRLVTGDKFVNFISLFKNTVNYTHSTIHLKTKFQRLLELPE